ncbi:hypothetical protein vseg_001226 [Gypsophila vaccaria]
MSYNKNNNNDDNDNDGGLSPSTEEDSSGLMLASDYPKKRAGRKKFKETRHPVYRGVRQRSSGKWVSEVRQPNNKKDRIWLGTYLTADMAARAHDVAAIALRGRQGACLNFADSVWRLPVPASSDTKDIQKAAAEAAEAFRPSSAGMAAQSQTLSVTLPPPHEDWGQMEQSSENVDYMDEDMLFGMPRLLSEMYQGLGMSPPPHFGGSSGQEFDYHNDHGDDEVYEYADVSLWNYSM